MITLALGVGIGIMLALNVPWIRKKSRKFKWTQLVQFEDGNYAMRRGFPGWYMYQDQKDNYWWPKSSRWFHHCVFSDPESWHKNIKDAGTPVKE